MSLPRGKVPLRIEAMRSRSFSRHRTARPSISAFAARVSIPSVPALRALPVTPERKMVSSPDFCRMARARSPFCLPFHRSGRRRITPPTTPSADFSTAITGLATRSAQFPGPPETSRGKIDRLHRTPAGYTTPSLMTADFAIISSLVRSGRPRYPVLVHLAATLLHASYRPRLAATPLRIANPSPPSGWIEDLHLQARRKKRGREQRPQVWEEPFLVLTRRSMG
jgi:hypothetical protein